MGQIRTKIPQVAILLETTHGYSRNLLQGILKYQNLHGPWGIYFEPGGSADQKLPSKKEWKGNGIICWITNQEVEQSVLSARIPTVLIDPWEEYIVPTHPFSKYCQVRGNSHEIGKMAAQFFLEKNFKNFAFVGDHPERKWGRDRQIAFTGVVSQQGYRCYSYVPEFQEGYEAEADRKRLARWLKKLPKPVGVFAAIDVRGRQILAACLQSGIRVPQEVSVLGVDNDVLLCETANPPLSSIALDEENAGYQAAELLDRLMKDRSLKGTVITYNPKQIINRRSTEIVPSSDKLIVETLEFIRINSGVNVNVADIVKYMNISRRTLECRFKSSLGCTILEEIQRVRIEKIKSLICETALPLHSIAEMCGFDSESYMGKVFKKFLGCSMIEYRQKHSALK
ncbi:MAG: XylR family transcriptional regulator [Planctomycetaceae bacterium]|nr:XylR family transcriptional regulator [Planctomycetaceae bacterium]